MSSVKSRLIFVFQIQGLSLRSNASKYLLELLEPLEKDAQNEWLKQIIDGIQKQKLPSPLIDKSVLEVVIKNITDYDKEDTSKIFSVIDAFSIPAYSYHKEKKKFVLKTVGYSPNLHGSAEAKASLYRERYKLIHQRTVYHQLFAPPAIVASSSQAQSFTLQPVEYLLSTTAKQGNLIVLGMLTQMKEGQYYLEDPTGAVQLDLSKAIYKGGLFTENCFVIAEGSLEDRVFHVAAIGFPPPEAARQTIQRFGGINFFGSPFPNSVRTSSQLKEHEKKLQDAMFVFVSDTWLDQIKVMQKLRILFAGYSEMPPTCFVFMGNFLSSPKGIFHTHLITECFKNFSNMISDFPSLVENSRFVFVPGPVDPGLSHIFPRTPLPEALLQDFHKKVPNAIFSTNPCRIQFCSQEIVIFREDLISKMCRNCIYMPWEHEERVDIPSLFVKTLIANGHLAPLPLSVTPIYWEFDHALCLYPLPDVVVCGDKYDPFCITSNDCIFINPGSFPKTDFSFKVYFPSSRQVEDSQISDSAS